MLKEDELFNIANKLALSIPDFFESKGPGDGNHSTNVYIKELGAQLKQHFGEDCSEQKICGNNSLAVDFYFRDCGTVVEVALGLRRPNSEFEKDILKVVMAKGYGNNIKKLVFISKPGGVKKCSQPGRLETINWLKKSSEIEVKVRDLG